MTPTTISQLTDLNQKFYTTAAAGFDQTRQAPWAGWATLLPFLDKIATAKLNTTSKTSTRKDTETTKLEDILTTLF